MIVDETTFDAYRKRVTELERDMEGVQKDILDLHKFVTTITASYSLMAIVEAAIITWLVMS